MTLFQTKGFTPLCLMIFLNAFIDLGHKITIQNIIFKLYDGSEQIILTAIVNALILLPYMIFFAPAGFVSDKFSKTIVLRFTASSVFFITIALSICYFFGWFWPAFGLTFLLAIQSAFYGPAKLGLVRELVASKHLSKANGAAQALTTLGILFGTLCFSILFEQRFDTSMQSAEQILSHMFILSLCLIGLALTESALSFLVPKTAISNTDIVNIKIKRITQQNTLWAPVIGLTAFWCIGQMLLATYPAFAKETMNITNTIVIQAMLALVAIGVMAGSIIAGIISKSFIQQRLIIIAGLMIILCLVLLPITQQVYLAGALFFLTGFSGGLFIVPLLATFQFSSEPSELGQNLANSNLIQNIAMTSCLLLTALAAFYNTSAMQILTLNIFIAVTAVTLIHFKMPHIAKEIQHPIKKRINIVNDDLLNGYNNLLIHSDENIGRLLQQLLPGSIRRINDSSYQHYSHEGATEKTIEAKTTQTSTVITILFTEKTGDSAV